MARVLITGASGFLGRAAAAALAARGHTLHAVARSSAADVPVDAWHTVDLLDSAAPDVVEDLGASHLLHLAWTTAHGTFWTDRANVDWAEATHALVDAFRAGGGERIVVTGSCAQYDWSSAALEPGGVASEERTPRRPATLYGQAKQSMSEQLAARAETMRLSYATGLVFFPYGPYDQATRLVPSVTRSLAAGEEAEVSAGTQVRDFVYASDVGGALAALLDSEVQGDVNIGTGRGASVADVAKTIARILGREELLRLGAVPATDDAPAVVADIGRLAGEVGFEPRYGLEDGLRDTVDWWVSASVAGTRPATR